MPRPTTINKPSVTTSAMIGVLRFGGAGGGVLSQDGLGGAEWKPTGCCGIEGG